MSAQLTTQTTSRRYCYCLRRIPGFLYSNSKWVGVLMTLVMFGLSNRYIDVLSEAYPPINSSISSAKKPMQRAIRDAHFALLREKRLGSSLTANIASIFLDPTLGDATIGLLGAFLEYSLAAWIFTTKALLLAFHIFRTAVKAVDCALPHVKPFVVAVVQEFLQLPVRARLVIAFSVLLNLCLFYLWKRRCFSGAIRALALWHRTVAEVFLLYGPYAAVTGLLYLPIKNALSLETFRVLFQSLAWGLIILQSCLVSTDLLIIKRKLSAPPTMSTASLQPLSGSRQSYQPPNSARLWSEAFRPQRAESPSVFSRFSASLATPRQLNATHFDEDQSNVVAKHIYQLLDFWAVVTAVHAMMILPERLAEWATQCPLPVFNIWQIGSATSNPSKRIMLTKAIIVSECNPLIGIQQVSWFNRLARTFALSVICIDEIILLNLISCAIIGDSRFALWSRRKSLICFERLIMFVTGFRIQTQAHSRRSVDANNEDSPFSLSSNGSWLSTAAVPIMGRARFCISQTARIPFTTIRSIFVHLGPLFFLFLPIFILRWIFLGVALMIPAVYSLRALEMHDVVKAAYWLLYYSSLILYICCLDGLAHSSPLAAWLVHSIRPKFVAVSMIQFLCTEPTTLGVWVAKHATRVSVSALATARRHVTRSPTLSSLLRNETSITSELPAFVLPPSARPSLTERPMPPSSSMNTETVTTPRFSVKRNVTAGAPGSDNPSASFTQESAAPNNGGVSASPTATRRYVRRSSRRGFRQNVKKDENMLLHALDGLGNGGNRQETAKERPRKNSIVECEPIEETGSSQEKASAGRRPSRRAGSGATRSREK